MTNLITQAQSGLASMGAQIQQGATGLASGAAQTTKNVSSALYTGMTQPTSVMTAVTNAITAISNTLVGLVTHIYGILVKQQEIYGIQQLVVGLCWTLGTWLIYRLVKSILKKSSWDTWDKDVVIFVLAIVAFVSLIHGISNIVASLPRVLNPEYYAIQDSVQLLQQVKQR